jgi:hypothetical protein
MFLSVQVVTLDVLVFAGRLQHVKTKTSKVTTCKDKNIKSYNL